MAGLRFLPDPEAFCCEVGEYFRSVMGVGVCGCLHPGMGGGGAFLPDGVAMVSALNLNRSLHWE